MAGVSPAVMQRRREALIEVLASMGGRIEGDPSPDKNRKNRGNAATKLRVAMEKAGYHVPTQAGWRGWLLSLKEKGVIDMDDYRTGTYAIWLTEMPEKPAEPEPEPTPAPEPAVPLDDYHIWKQADYVGVATALLDQVMERLATPPGQPRQAPDEEVLVRLNKMIEENQRLRKELRKGADVLQALNHERDGLRRRLIKAEADLHQLREAINHPIPSERERHLRELRRMMEERPQPKRTD